MKLDELKTAIENVIDKRHSRGASDESIIGYLEHLKSKYTLNKNMVHYLEQLISGVKSSPQGVMAGIEPAPNN